MKQSLDLRLGQHLTITPQLQQAIRLLQLSSIELQQEIQQALESNPLLEENEGETEETREDAKDDEVGGESDDGADENDATDGSEYEIEMESASLDDAASNENDWGDSYELPVTRSTRSDDDGLPDIDSRNSPKETLREHLLWQMRMVPFSATDRLIASSIIDAINEDGYLTSTIDEIHQILNKERAAISDRATAIEIDEIEAVLHQVHNFDPVGVGARDLAECLHLQLRALSAETAGRAHAMALATPEHLAQLGSRDYTQLRRALKASPEELQIAIALIQQLNPRPGGTVEMTHAAYVVPDLIVRKVRGIWRADLNHEVAPKLRVNRMYARLIHRGDTSSQNRYLQDQLQQARWLIKSLQSRNETLLKVGRTIVDRQRAFFDHGPEAMKPLVLHDIAESVGMHESTISRVTTNKYMLTPRGIFELKYFFSSHVSTADGGTCSATAIRSLIKKIVEDEVPAKPVSDSRIADMLAEQGINVARRTIAKYRESMNIPPSNQRKSLI